MATGQSKSNLPVAGLLSLQDFSDNLDDRLTEQQRLLGGDVWGGGGVLGGTRVSFTMSTLTFSLATSPWAGWNGNGERLSASSGSGWNNVPYPNTGGVTYYIAARSNLVPTVVRTGTDGLPYYRTYIEDIGELGQPDAVVVNGNNLVLTLTTVACAGWTSGSVSRPVTVWLATPVTGSSAAIFTGTATYTSGAVKVTVNGYLGQTTPSTTASDYKVFIKGPTVKTSSMAADANYIQFGTSINQVFDNSSQVLLESIGDYISAFLVEHRDTGSHRAMTVIPDNSGQVKIDITTHASDASSQTHVRLHTAGGTNYLQVRGDYTQVPELRAPTRVQTAEISLLNLAGSAFVIDAYKASVLSTVDVKNTAAAGTVKMKVWGALETTTQIKALTGAFGSAEAVRIVDGGADADHVLIFKNLANATALAVRADGRLLRTRWVNLGPMDFVPISTKASSSYEEWTMGTNGNIGDFGGSSPDNTSRYLHSRSIELQEGEKIIEVYLAGNKTSSGQVIEAKLHSKDWDNAYGAATTVHATCACAASTGDLVASSTGLSISGSMDKVYWIRVELNDNSTGQASLRGARVAIAIG